MAKGRKRKSGPRMPNGHLRELPPSYRPSDAHLRAIGVDPEDRRITCVIEARRIAAGAKPRDERAATPIGLMRALGLLGDLQTPEGKQQAERLYLAAELYEKNQLRLRRHVPPPGFTRSNLAQFLVDEAPQVYGDIDGDDFNKQYRRCRWVEREVTARVWDWRGIESLVVKHEVPEFFAAPGTVKAAHRLHTVQHDLEEIAKFFDRPPPRDEGGAQPKRIAALLKAGPHHTPERA